MRIVFNKNLINSNNKIFDSIRKKYATCMVFSVYITINVFIIFFVKVKELFKRERVKKK